MTESMAAKLRVFICLEGEVRALDKSQLQALHAFKNTIATAAELLYAAVPQEKADKAVHAALSRFLKDNPK